MTEPLRPAEGAPLPAPQATPPPPPPTVPQPHAAPAPPPVPPTASAAEFAPWPGQPTTEPLANVIAKPKSSTGRGTSLLMGLAAAIAIGGLAFAAGRLTAPAAAASAGQNRTGQFPAGGQGFQGGGQGFAGRNGGLGGITVKGTVEAISADSVTLKLASGTSITIPLNASTTYHAATPSSAAAVTVGSQVSVTPGARTPGGATPGPNVAPNPNASGAPGFGGFSFGAATDVTVEAP